MCSIKSRFTNINSLLTPEGHQILDRYGFHRGVSLSCITPSEGFPTLQDPTGSPHVYSGWGPTTPYLLRSYPTLPLVRIEIVQITVIFAEILSPESPNVSPNVSRTTLGMVVKFPGHLSDHMIFRNPSDRKSSPVSPTSSSIKDVYDCVSLESSCETSRTPPYIPRRYPTPSGSRVDCRSARRGQVGTTNNCI